MCVTKFSSEISYYSFARLLYPIICSALFLFAYFFSIDEVSSKTIFVFTIQTVIAFFPRIFVAWNIFHKLWSLYYLGCFFKKNVHFWTWAPRYWIIHEITFWRIYISKNDRLIQVIFSMTSSVLFVKKAHIVRNEKPFSWTWRILNYYRAPIFTQFYINYSIPNAVNCPTLNVYKY